MKLLSRHTRLEDAKKSLLALRDTLEHEGREYKEECGHTGNRWAIDPFGEYFALTDLLGSGDRYFVSRDGESYIVGAELQ